MSMPAKTAFDIAISFVVVFQFAFTVSETNLRAVQDNAALSAKTLDE